MRRNSPSRKSPVSNEVALNVDSIFARKRLLAEIAGDARRTRDYTGRAAFARVVMQALATVPREAFVPKSQRRNAYDNCPLPIGQGQTISQPYIVALMTDLLDIKSDDRILEIGTGSGYQTAVLASLAREVFTVEFIEDLHQSAKERLSGLGYKNIQFQLGDGWEGWLDHAPYNAIIVTAAASRVPERLKKQLATGGRLLVPVGYQNETQFITRIILSSDGIHNEERGLPVTFVPLVESD
jgi:protein-L-isoaspartate(D-aspartate) O-methyltransferase